MVERVYQHVDVEHHRSVEGSPGEVLLHWQVMQQSHSLSSHANADKGDRVDCCAVGILVFLHFADELCFGGWDTFLVFW